MSRAAYKQAWVIMHNIQVLNVIYNLLRAQKIQNRKGVIEVQLKVQEAWMKVHSKERSNLMNNSI